MFIAVEGMDAAGKFTQTELLKKHYEKLGGKTVVKFDFPKYESITGQMIKDHLMGKWKAEAQVSSEAPQAARHVLTGPYSTDPSTYLFQCCQITNRLECLPDAVWEQRKDHVFIADRYNASAYAYGKAFGIDFDWLVKTHRHLPQPDMNIFLDISVEESFRRRPERRDNYERNGEMLNRVRSCYIDVFNVLGPKYVIIDASGTIEQTFGKILAAITVNATV